MLAYPSETFRGKVVRIGNVVETESRTVEARIEVNNSDGRLKPGMFADVEIVTTVLQDVMVIPGQRAANGRRQSDRVRRAQR